MRVQNKIGSIAGKMRQSNVINQQGTTRHIWDTLQIVAGTRYYRFFEGVNTRTFPFTNLTDNKLEAGESLACQFIYINVYDVTESTGAIAISAPPVEIYAGALAMELMNTIVMKPIRILSFIAAFNRMPNSAGNVYKLYTNQVILPLTPFTFPLHISKDPTITQGHALYVQLTVEGTGSILSPKGTL